MDLAAENKELMSKFMRCIGYTLFTVLVTGLFLILLFPSRAMESYLTRRFNQAYPLFSLSLNELLPTLSGIVVNRAALALSAYEDQPVFEAEKIRIRLLLGELVQGRLRFGLEGKTGQGKIDGALHPQVSGTDIRLHLEEAKIETPLPILGIRRISIRRADLDMALTPGAVRIHRGDFSCDKGAASLNGTVFIEKSNMEQSRLELTGKVAATASGENGINVSLNGPLSGPRIRFGSIR